MQGSPQDITHLWNDHFEAGEAILLGRTPCVDNLRVAQPERAKRRSASNHLQEARPLTSNVSVAVVSGKLVRIAGYETREKDQRRSSPKFPM